jgi:hypothetical protein
MDTSITFPSYSNLSADIKPLEYWIFQMIRPYLNGRMLEINGASISLCPLLIEHNYPIHLSDANLENCEKLLNKYKNAPIIRGVHSFDITSHDFQQFNTNTRNVFNTVIALKLGILDFKKAAVNIKYVLPSGGILIMILPAYNYLYVGLENSVDDWKKYNDKSIKQILPFGFSVMKVRFFQLSLTQAQDGFAHSGLSALVVFRKT